MRMLSNISSSQEHFNAAARDRTAGHKLIVCGFMMGSTAVEWDSTPATTTGTAFSAPLFFGKAQVLAIKWKQ
jgi:hypothetical protein